MTNPSNKTSDKATLTVNTDEPIKPSKSLISPRDHIESYLTFTFIGFVGLYSWNCVLNAFYDIMGDIYGDIALTDSIILLYETFNIMMYFVLIYKGSVRPKLLQAGCYINSCFVFLIPVIIQLFGNGSTTGIVLLHLVVIPISICIGILVGVGFSLSSAMPTNYGGFVGFGQGISGIGSFALYLLSDRILFQRPDDPDIRMSQLTKTTWLLFGCGGVFNIIGGFLIHRMEYKKWFNERVTAYWAQYQLENSPSEKVDESKIPLIYRNARPIKKIVSDCWPQLFNSYFGLGITLFLFPLIGPFAWLGSNMNDINVGTFQIFDFIGRYIPVISSKLRLRKDRLIYATVCRFLFIPLFTLCAFWTPLTFFNTFWFQALIMAIFSLTNGWILTQTMINIPEYVERIKEKGRVGAYNGFAIQASVVSGLYGSKLYKIILDALFGMSSQATPFNN